MEAGRRREKCEKFSTALRLRSVAETSGSAAVIVVASAAAIVVASAAALWPPRAIGIGAARGPEAAAIRGRASGCRACGTRGQLEGTDGLDHVQILHAEGLRGTAHALRIVWVVHVLNHQMQITPPPQQGPFHSPHTHFSNKRSQGVDHQTPVVWLRVF